MRIMAIGLAVLLGAFIRQLNMLQSSTLATEARTSDELSTMKNIIDDVSRYSGHIGARADPTSLIERGRESYVQLDVSTPTVGIVEVVRLGRDLRCRAWNFLIFLIVKTSQERTRDFRKRVLPAEAGPTSSTERTFWIKFKGDDEDRKVPEKTSFSLVLVLLSFFSFIPMLL